MSAKLFNGSGNAYPGYSGTETDIACAAEYSWGSIQATHGAVEAYELQINPAAPEASIENDMEVPFGRFRTDILIAGPHEVDRTDDHDSLVVGSSLHRKGVRTTLAADVDLSIAGLDLASRLISSMAAGLPEDKQAAFLRKRGSGIQDEVKENLPVLFNHSLAHAAGAVALDSYEQWAEKRANRFPKKMIGRAATLACVSSGAVYSADWYADNVIENHSFLFTVGYTGFLALRARAEIAEFKKNTTQRDERNYRLAQAFSIQVERDTHALLCGH